MKLIRRFAERIARRRSFTRRLPAEFGRRPLIVSPDAALKLLTPSEHAFDPMLLRFASREVRERMTVWDIGANVGIFAVAAAHQAKRGQVICIEPDPFLADLLRRTKEASANADLQLTVLPMAISDRVGFTHLHVAQRGRAANAIAESTGSTQMGGVRSKIAVPTLRLDDLFEFAGAPSVIKIDVEGAEHLVLRGALQTLAVARPVILVEVTAENADEVVCLLREANYTLFDGDAADPREAPVDRCVTNSLAIPLEKVA